MNTVGAVVRRGVAGPAEDEVRSDARVVIEPTNLRGLEIHLESRVASMYGEAIRRHVMEALSEMGVDGARVEIRDGGALPFVLAARLETAAARAGLAVRRPRCPEIAAGPRPPSPRNRLRRSRLYLPGNQPKFFPNAGLHRPDAVILDLEDSVHPDQKDAARVMVRNALCALDFGDAERMVRINQLPVGLTDLEFIVPEQPDLILIPKTEDPDQVRQVDAAIRALPQPSDESRPIWLMPIIETALGVERAYEIAAASDRVVAVTIGLEDYTADLGVPKTIGGKETLFARSRLVNAARAAGVQAIDSVFGDVADEAALVAWATSSRALGFEGMGCIHPRQIRPIHAAFAPTEAEIERALKVVRAFQDAEVRGLSVVSLGTRMIDPPVVLRAQQLVERARRTGLLEPDPGEEDR